MDITGSKRKSIQSFIKTARKENYQQAQVFLNRAMVQKCTRRVQEGYLPFIQHLLRKIS
jgi:hypothetical protein